MLNLKKYMCRNKKILYLCRWFVILKAQSFNRGFFFPEFA